MMFPYRSTRDSAGVIVFRRSGAESEVLMISMKGFRFSFPKGHIEDGETEQEAALREVREETGITAELVGDFRQSVPSARAGDRRQIIFFLGRYVSGIPTPQPHEVGQVEWWPASAAADRITFDADREIYLRALDAWNKLQK